MRLGYPQSPSVSLKKKNWLIHIRFLLYLSWTVYTITIIHKGEESQFLITFSCCTTTAVVLWWTLIGVKCRMLQLQCTKLNKYCWIFWIQLLKRFKVRNIHYSYGFSEFRKNPCQYSSRECLVKCRNHDTPQSIMKRGGGIGHTEVWKIGWLIPVSSLHSLCAAEWNESSDRIEQYQQISATYRRRYVH